MRTLLAILAGASLLACAGSDSNREPRFTPASRQIAPDETNGVCFASLTKARCDHDQDCDFIGPGKRYENRDACLNHYNADGYKSLESCTVAIERRQLRECLASINAASCDSPVVDIGAIDACNYGTLCRGMQ